MNELQWLASDDPDELIAFLDPDIPNTKQSRKQRLFGVAVCYRVYHLFRHECCANALLLFEEGAHAPPDFADDDAMHRAADGIVLSLVSSGDDLPPPSAQAQEAVAALLSGHWYHAAHLAWEAWSRAQNGPAHAGAIEALAQADLLRDIFGNPFRPVTFSHSWRTSTASSLAQGMYDARDFSAMPILADALQDAGCDSAEVLAHCRGPGPHARGCWVVDLVLGKE